MLVLSHIWREWSKKIAEIEGFTHFLHMNYLWKNQRAIKPQVLRTMYNEVYNEEWNSWLSFWCNKINIWGSNGENPPYLNATFIAENDTQWINTKLKNYSVSYHTG